MGGQYHPASGFPEKTSPGKPVARGGAVNGGDQERHRAYVAGLTNGERLLVSLRDELYEGSWDLMLEDLRDRLEKRPYIFKLSSRIEADMTAIEKLRAYEVKESINLRDYLGGSPGEGVPDDGEAE
jgi:hypothetical protein